MNNWVLNRVFLNWFHIFNLCNLKLTKPEKIGKSQTILI